jgi:glycogen debranching enzyme
VRGQGEGAAQQHFPLPGPTGGAGCTATWESWRDAIQASFEPHYYVPTVEEEAAAAAAGGAAAAAAASSSLHTAAFINRRGMYKDTVGSSGGWPDYQLRPNFLVAMAVAPGLFTPARADAALRLAEACLLREGSRGVATLDPGDWAYRGDYDNGYAGEDRARAGGWNYHQGPEWLWPFGFYLRARLAFPPGGGGAWRSPRARVQWVQARLWRTRVALEEGAEGGLPELTNSRDAHCRDSCSVQAWSSSCILDALQVLHQMQ